MEAADIVGLSPGFRFDPDDDDLVAYYLLPRVRGQRLPIDGVIVEDDPLSSSPCDLLDKHGRKKDAFFFAPAHSATGKGSRQKRTCVGGGCWMGQRVCNVGKKLRVPAGGDVEMEIMWKKYMLNFHAEGHEGSTGWVMHEYAITEPSALASSPVRLCRIRFSGHGKNRKRKLDDCGEDDGVAARSAARPKISETTPLEELHLSPAVRSDPVEAVVLNDEEDAAVLVSGGCGAVPKDASSCLVSSDLGDEPNMQEVDFMNFEIPEDGLLLSGFKEFVATGADLCALPPLEEYPAPSAFQPAVPQDPVEVVVLDDEEDANATDIGACVCGAVPEETSSYFVSSDVGDEPHMLDFDFMNHELPEDDLLVSCITEFFATAEPFSLPPAAEANADFDAARSVGAETEQSNAE